MANLDRIEYLQHSGVPRVRLRLLDDDDEPVDLTVGYSDLHARVSKKAAPTASVLAITDVTAAADGFSIAATTMNDLAHQPDYLLTASAKHDGTGEYRRAQCELEILPAPAP